MKKARLFRGLAGIFLAIAVAFSVATSVATAWAGKVDELLGTSKSGIERSTDPEDYRYKSDFSKAGDLVAAEIAYATRVSAEGSVALKGTPAVEGTKVTLFGMRSGSKMQFGGTMGELVEASQAVTLADAMTKEGFSVNPQMVQFYADKAANYAPTKAMLSVPMMTRVRKSVKFLLRNMMPHCLGTIKMQPSSSSAAMQVNQPVFIRVRRGSAIRMSLRILRPEIFCL